MLKEKLLAMNEFGAAGLYEEPERSLFYRKALGMRRFFENYRLPEYNGELLYPSGDVPRVTYWTGLAIDFGRIRAEDETLAEEIESEFCAHVSRVPEEHGIGGNMFVHSIPYYERVLKEGFLSYIPRIAKIQDTEIREGLLHLVEGIACYCKRCVAYLESVGADRKLIEALKKVPMLPADNIYEAVVCWNFVFYLDCDNPGCLASGLYPYYNGEDITDLLKNFFDNVDAVWGFNVVLGTDYNALTLQCLEAAKGKRKPQIELFVDKNTPDEIWEKAFELVKTSGGQPAFYNPVLLEKLQKRFPRLTDEDVKRWCGGGCTESMIAGLSNVGSIDAGIHLPLILEETIKTQLTEADGFEDFYNRYIQDVRKIVDQVTVALSESRKDRVKLSPHPMRTLLIDDCIDKGLDFYNGGPRYHWSVVNFAGLINVIDAMLVIRDFVFEKQRYSPEELIQKLKDNDLEFLKEARNCKVSFGNDNLDANAFTARISEDIFSMLDDKDGFLIDGFLPASIQFNSQVKAGKMVGATPDGREKEAPLADSLAAIFGKDVKGPTALLNSVTSLNLERALGIPILNFNINPEFKNEVLKSLILGYMEKGGIQMQITCVSRETLEAAYKEPELYKNLVVRVGGYSEYFYLLCDDLKKLVINRTIQN